MNYLAMIQLMREQLLAIYSENEQRSLVRIWADDQSTDLYRKLISEPVFNLSEQQASLFKSYVLELSGHKPYQYALGYADFFSLRFEVNSSTLIPRPETEELVQWVIERYQTTKRPLTVLDVGTGSGCIAITLSKHLTISSIFAIDSSKKAIECAKRNAKNHRVEVAFERIDMRHYIPKVKFDLIVSNPPYIRELEKKEMKKNVLDHEPHQALFVPNEDPLVHYRDLAKMAKLFLKPSGGIYLEVNERFASEVAALFNDFNQVEVRKDLFGKPRMVGAYG
jgi:release factor glutamine methyltransferase